MSFPTASLHLLPSSLLYGICFATCKLPRPHPNLPASPAVVLGTLEGTVSTAQMGRLRIRMGKSCSGPCSRLAGRTVTQSHMILCADPPYQWTLASTPQHLSHKGVVSKSLCGWRKLPVVQKGRSAVHLLPFPEKTLGPAQEGGGHWTGAGSACILGQS